MHGALDSVAQDLGSTAAAVRQLETAKERVSELVNLVVRQSDEMLKDFEELPDARPFTQLTLFLSFARSLAINFANAQS